MKIKLVFIILLILSIEVNSTFSQTIINGIINSYYQVILIKDNNSILVKDASGLKQDDYFFIIQMKGAIIDTTNTPKFGDIIDYENSGNFELHQIAEVSFNNIKTKKPLRKRYSIPGLVQLVKVNVIKSAKIISELTCKEWDGNTGGILGLIIEDTLFLEGNINVSKKGFRGGQRYNPPGGWNGSQKEYYYPFPTPFAARKGEGIAILGEDKICGRGKLANGGGGGNDHNAGGGGGSNADTGGRGGNQWLYPTPRDYHENGGHGGTALDYDLSGYLCRAFLGGGGGAGHENQNGGTAGGNGGGIIYIKSKAIKSINKYSINANGEDVPVTTGPDAAGGGGGGGVIILDVDYFDGDVLINAKGGKGGDASHNILSTCHGPGGGGSGGFVFLKHNFIPNNLEINVDGGISGIFVDKNLNCTGSKWGSTDGGKGKVVLNFDPSCIYYSSFKDSCVSIFDYPNFLNVKDLLIIGDSYKKDSVIRLTDIRPFQAGAVWYSKKVNIAEGFSTKFAFKLSQGNNNDCKDNSLQGADGLAFVIQNSSITSLGWSGGGLGYDGIPNSLAVEFDTFNNDSTQIENLFDPNGNHIAIQSCGSIPNTAKHNKECNIAINPNIFPLRSDGTIYYSKIDYHIKDNKFIVFLDTLPIFRYKVIELNNFDINKFLNLEHNKFAYVGFTAATGCAVENHDLLAWDFCTMKKNILDIRFDNSNENDFSFEIFPNPVQDEISVKINSNQEQMILLEIFNLLGNKIYIEKLDVSPQKSIKLKLDTKQLPIGTYFCKILSFGESYIKKFIITK